MGAGSSPLTRGKRVNRLSHGKRHGLIPAHAGKTGRADASAPREPAHPRSRGENSRAPEKPPFTAGSSPLTRGKRDVDLGLRGAEGLIPAHAGKTCSSSRCRTAARAHPRSRGENRVQALTPCLIEGSSSLTRENMVLTFRSIVGWGSSPLTRGKRRAARLHVRLGGLIPAHAGKTSRQPVAS